MKQTHFSYSSKNKSCIKCKIYEDVSLRFALTGMAVIYIGLKVCLNHMLFVMYIRIFYMLIQLIQIDMNTITVSTIMIIQFT